MILSQKTLKNVVSGKNKFVLVGLLVAAVLMYLVVGPLDLLSVGGSYSNAYEGAKPSFAGVSFSGKNYASSQTGGYRSTWNIAADPYVQLNGMSFSFKGDGAVAQYSGLPKLVGEMTPVFIPQSTGAGDLPSSFNLGGVTITNPFTSSFSLIKNPYSTYNWQISSGSSTTYYTMEEWKTKFYVSISANPDGASAPFTKSQWDQENGRYSDVTVWIKLDTTPTWYFQGQDKAYFAIAQVQLSGISYGGHTPEGAVQSSHNQQLIAVNPASPSSAVTLYLNNFGVGGNQAADPDAIYKYKGLTLNPQYFGNAVYFPVSLNSFGSQSWWDWTTFKAQGDVVSFDFTVTQFVVGQWTVKNIQEVPQGFGRPSSYSEYGLSGVTDFLNELGSNPIYQMIALGLIVIVILGVMIVFFPEFIGLANKGAKFAGSKFPKSRKRGRATKFFANFAYIGGEMY